MVLGFGSSEVEAEPETRDSLGLGFRLYDVRVEFMGNCGCEVRWRYQATARKEQCSRIALDLTGLLSYIAVCSSHHNLSLKLFHL